MVTGTSQMEPDWVLMETMIFTSISTIRELTYVAQVPPHHLACIVVTLQVLIVANLLRSLEVGYMLDCMQMEVCIKQNYR